MLYNILNSKDLVRFSFIHTHGVRFATQWYFSDYSVKFLAFMYLFILGENGRNQDFDEKNDNFGNKLQLRSWIACSCQRMGCTNYPLFLCLSLSEILDASLWLVYSCSVNVTCDATHDVTLELYITLADVTTDCKTCKTSSTVIYIHTVSYPHLSVLASSHCTCNVIQTDRKLGYYCSNWPY